MSGSVGGFFHAKTLTFLGMCWDLWAFHHQKLGFFLQLDHTVQDVQGFWNEGKSGKGPSKDR